MLFRSGVSEGDCDAVNRWTTLLIRMVVSFVPVGFTLLPAARSGRRGAWALVGLIGLYEAMRQVWLVSTALSRVVCTYPGPHHHQVWGDLTPGMPALVGLSVYVGVPSLAVGLFLQPRVLAWALVAVTAASLGGVLAQFDVEAESVWCWTCSALLGVGLLEPRLVRWFGGGAA